MEIVTRRVITPRHCTLGVGIPTSEEDFHAAVRRSSTSFAGMHMPKGGWLLYARQVGLDLDSLMRDAQRRNVRLHRRVTRNTLHELFADPERPVVFVVGHWDDDLGAIELSDGLVTVKDFVAAVPEDFSGIIDFCVCTPLLLTKALRRNRKHCVVRLANNTLTPHVWTAFYSVLFGVLASESRTYLQAVEEVVHEFTKS